MVLTFKGRRVKASSKPSRYAPYRSGLEKKIADQLTEMGVPFEYEKKVINYTKQHKYVADFLCTPIGNFIIEGKGYFTSEDRAKHRLIQEQHPELDIRFLFGNASNKLNKKSTTTYADWCIKHGFKYAEKIIPRGWFKKSSPD